MGGKDKPAVGADIVVNGALDGVEIIPALLEKGSQIIQIGSAAIESLAAAAGTFISI